MFCGRGKARAHIGAASRRTRTNPGLKCSPHVAISGNFRCDADYNRRIYISVVANRATARRFDLLPPVCRKQQPPTDLFKTRLHCLSSFSDRRVHECSTKLTWKTDTNYNCEAVVLDQNTNHSGKSRAGENISRYTNILHSGASGVSTWETNSHLHCCQFCVEEWKSVSVR